MQSSRLVRDDARAIRREQTGSSPAVNRNRPVLTRGPHDSRHRDQCPFQVLWHAGRPPGLIPEKLPKEPSWGFLGPTGAGKTTTIRILVGLRRPTAGFARLFGRDCWSDGPRLRAEIGYLPGEFHLYETLTGRRHFSSLPMSAIDVPPGRRFVGFDAYKQVIASGVDVVLLCTPPHFRPIHLEAAVEAGKHVFAEKPVAVDAPGVRSVLATCERAKAAAKTTDLPSSCPILPDELRSLARRVEATGQHDMVLEWGIPCSIRSVVSSPWFAILAVASAQPGVTTLGPRPGREPLIEGAKPKAPSRSSSIAPSAPRPADGSAGWRASRAIR